ncbi:MAG: Sec-independent protein translocase protein TatB [Gammaproteobacteria bacterium]|jgi:sec-independent protein translocase protein TatB
MFDIGFWEIIFIMVVALLVVGPERLPRIARTAGLWIGKMRGFVASVKADIDHELAAEELRKTLAKQTAVPELEELVDEVTGEPLKAGERPAPAKPDRDHEAAGTAAPDSGTNADDSAK